MTIERTIPVTPAPSVAIIPSSHLDLFWLGDYRNCLRRGDDVIRSYVDRAVESGDETFVIDTAIFAEHFLAEHPEYEGRVRRLIAEGRLEIGAAYIDRWENLVLGESIIRNIQIGRSWAKDRLGIETKLAAHPDLPGLNAQTAQIYSQAGIGYYVTSRKLFQEGRIWRHRAPDGSALTMLTWPWHYVFIPLDGSGLDPRASGDAFVNSGTSLSFDDVEGRYPHGVIPVSGSAGDLTTAADFTTRYGKDQREYVGQYRASGVDVGYAIPATVLAPYLDSDTELPEVTGSLPSVWGVAPDEEMRFFHRVRALEELLLDAETASVIGVAAGRPALPESAGAWRGLFAEDAYFAAPDTPPAGKEWEWLWRMHVFTQDHNGGGQDGPLSIFQKKVRHDRARGYALDVLQHALGSEGSTQPSVLRTRLGHNASEVVVDAETADALEPWLRSQPAGSWQSLLDDDGTRTIALALDPVTGVGARPLEVDGSRTAPFTDRNAESVRIGTDSVEVTIDRATGATTIRDVRSGSDRVVPLGGAYAVPELGNDVTLATDESGRIDAVVLGVDLLDAGPIVARAAIRWRLLDVVWTTSVRVWAGSGRVDVETVVDWPGFERWQIRLPLAAAPRAQVTHGTPFHASGWLEVPAEQHPLMPDEISADDLAAYREVQHWVHVGWPQAEPGLAVLTTHPAFRHDGGTLEAVLLRTAPSCGDPRMAWTNPGRTSWAFTLLATDADWRRADVPELADIAWREPRVVAAGAPERVELLTNEGEPVRLSALFLDGDEVTARLVNQSDRPATVRLRGRAVGDSAVLTDLDGRPQHTVDAADGALTITLPAWRIQTIRLGALRAR
ncbi:glycoside hydrolase family 38 N-terminal domain-containing protein [Leifsonia poae]|uniref:glycoside hydrolase family 38 N-terminal domain-containing protein n=1 Tax=Leifsonia poae TaxID=110933 RepID=UPI001CBBA9A2|nr:hypothetical protein [Leifsonia poae]